MTNAKSYYDITSPPAMDHLLKRHHVDSLLREAFKKPFISITAGAGYGKTQAVLAALKGTQYKSAWIPLSELDNHAARFWERIAHAFDAYSRNLSHSLITLGFPESIIAFDQFLRLLARELTPEETYVLVFDDFHCISSKAILNFFELLLSARMHNISFVFISRTKPSLNLSGLQTKGLLTSISENDLHFSREEMDAYFHKQGIVIPASLSQKIYAYTNGWITAIYLVCLAIKKAGFSKQCPILAAKLDLFDLIDEEIFSLASKKLQELLVDLSALEAIPSGLLKELASQDIPLITEMMRLSSFIRYDPASDSYIIHNLFREFLLERKARPAASHIREMHLKAAEWFLHNDHKYEAIEHYRACGLYDKIFEIMLSITYHIPQEVADFFICLIEEAPEEIIRKKPIIRVSKASYMCNNNRIDEARQELVNIRKEFEALPKTAKNQAVLGEVYLRLALISIINIDYEFVELFKMADACLPEGSKLVDVHTSFAEGENMCSIRESSAGELKKHQDALFSAAPYMSRATNGSTHGMEYLNAAESSFYTGALKDAEKYAYEAMYRARQYQQHRTAYMANFVIIRILTAKGNYPKIMEILNQMKTQLEDPQFASCIALYDIIEGWLYVKLGATEKIAPWIKYEEETRKMLAPVILGREYLVRSDSLLVEGRYYELLAFTEQTDRLYKARGILFARLQNKITRAIIHHYTGNYEEAIHMLHEAYALAHPNNLIMQFIEYGNQMRTLIHAARRNDACKIPKVWLDKIYTKSSTYAKQLTQVVSAYNKIHEAESLGRAELSKRESEVLEYLARGLTREEIAESCYLAVGTVNDILNNIYSKLGAINAADAIRIAKEKNLL